MTPGNPTPTDEMLFRTELLLEQEADEVESDLALRSLLGSVGRPVRVGSAALGVMVHRDLDLTVVCSELSVLAVAEVGAQLALHSRVRSVVLRNDTGEWNVDPAYPDGLYLGIGYRSSEGDWNIDVWFVDQPERQPDLRHLESLLPRMDERARSAILRIKGVWVEKPEYGRTVTGLDIYTAVLNAGVSDTRDFEGWLRQR